MKRLSYYSVLVLSVFLWSCKKSDNSTPTTTTPATTAAITIDSPAQVTGQIDGTSYSKVEDLTTIQSGVGSDKSLTTPPDTSSGKYSCFFTNAASTVTYFDVKKGTMRFLGFAPANTDFKAFFNPGTYSYSAGAINGMRIIYYDNSSVQWSTDLGSQDQSGSSFVVTDIKVMSGTSDYTVKIKASFNCKLYNSVGQTKNFTNGIFIGYFSNQ